MPFKIVHKNSLGCDLNEGDEPSELTAPWSDELECNNKLAAYVRATEVQPGDTLAIVEI